MALVPEKSRIECRDVPFTYRTTWWRYRQRKRCSAYSLLGALRVEAYSARFLTVEQIRAASSSICGVTPGMFANVSCLILTLDPLKSETTPGRGAQADKVSATKAYTFFMGFPFVFGLVTTSATIYDNGTITDPALGKRGQDKPSTANFFDYCCWRVVGKLLALKLVFVTDR